MATPLIASDPSADAERLRRLRRMQAVALGLLVLAAVVYVATIGRTGVWGFVNAGAEASMVGAIADWFAVTALFRHPLGLPIPHTALIPERKDTFGTSLEEFFAENFLQEQVIRERLSSADVVGRLGTWLTDPAHADRVVAESSVALAVGLRRLKDEDVAAVVREVIIPRFVSEPISPVAGGFLAEVVRDGAHHGLVDLALTEAHDWLVQHQERFTQVIGERAPWWAPDRLNEVIVTRLHLEAIRWVADIRSDPDHSARQALDSFLAQLADDLLNDPETQERAENLKQRLLEQPQMVTTGMSLWAAFRTALLDALETDDGPLRRRASQELAAFGGRIGTDRALHDRLEGWGADVVVWAVGRYGQELTSVITATIARWDGEEAARKIELHVGRDLQFIRINGTIVGGLVGVVIHAVTLVL
ncbi:Uncharacterized membrane-anchored protein YjiN, DUF445 family [Nocardioides scoriae]|uniref:Uncharacterized membrane-anchored protein YjiN, DUF445 family n=1 Tax=Nocardioides scoriae TaxID=642780 RepID=A0A1H1XTY9_9ACTN|nr:DUF445 domain-containing protein [Nocardioides scoriae]SDT12491.1 Uncharacterized membrane-anchored protein YjiN, DUF445 family [Nocardioides scoriae]